MHSELLGHILDISVFTFSVQPLRSLGSSSQCEGSVTKYITGGDKEAITSLDPSLIISRGCGPVLAQREQLASTRCDVGCIEVVQVG
jgi:hypothetical protein